MVSGRKFFRHGLVSFVVAITIPKSRRSAKLAGLSVFASRISSYGLVSTTEESDPLLNLQCTHELRSGLEACSLVTTSIASPHNSENFSVLSRRIILTRVRLSLARRPRSLDGRCDEGLGPLQTMFLSLQRSQEVSFGNLLNEHCYYEFNC